MRVGEIWKYINDLEMHYGYLGESRLQPGDKVVIIKLLKNMNPDDDGENEGVEFKSIDGGDTSYLYKKYFLQHFEKYYDAEINDAFRE